MRKLTKILTVIITVMLFTSISLIAVGCGENPDDKAFNGYKFTVVDESGNKISGVQVQLCTDENCLIPVTTDSEGVALFDFGKGYTAGVYAIHIIQNEENGKVIVNGEEINFVFDNNAYKTAAEAGEYTLTVKAA